MAAGTEQIRHDIEETRLRMGETIEALREKADVTGRAQESLSHATGAARVMLGDARAEVGHVAGTGWHQAAALAHVAGEHVERLTHPGEAAEGSAGAADATFVRRLSMALGAFGAVAYALGSRRKKD